MTWHTGCLFTIDRSWAQPTPTCGVGRGVRRCENGHRLGAADGQRADVLLLGFAAFAWFGAAAHLAWLGLRFIPTHAALFERIGVATPLYLRLVHLAPHEATRWLPVAILAAPFVGLVLTPLAIRLSPRSWWSGLTIVRALTLVALAGTSVTVLASFAVVQVTQAVYDRVVMETRFQNP